MNDDMNRRAFLLQAGTTAGAAWLSANWPAILVAAEHAHKAVQASPPAKLEVLTPEQAREFEAIAAQIIPADDTPGAREAGAVYFLDKALQTFAKSQKEPLSAALAQVQTETKELFGGVERFSTASEDQQVAVLKAIEKTPSFGLLRFHTVAGYLADPVRGGNRGEVGWKALGFDSSHVYQPPFGYYDKDYPGWQPNPAEADKKP